MTKDEAIWYAIQDIVRKHTKQNWITPYSCKISIPNEEILPLKEELFKFVKEFTKGNDK